MDSISFEDLAAQLVPEALALLGEMVDAYQAVGSGDRRFLEISTNLGTHLRLQGRRGTAARWDDVDAGALREFAGFGLLRVEYSRQGTPNYWMTGGAVNFVRWCRARAGGAVDQVEQQVRTLVEGERFARVHRDAAHHLEQALNLLWSERNDVPTLSELGDHLRKAIMDTTSGVVQDEHPPEKPIARLRAHLKTKPLGSREALALERLVDLADAVLKVDHHLEHLRDEANKGEPLATWEEARRAVFLTTMVCYEIAAL